MKADACSISPFKPTKAALPYAKILSPDPISFTNSGTRTSPSFGAKSNISGLRF